MMCACDVDDKGEVTRACGAHMSWLRYVVTNNEWEKKAKDLEKVQKDLEYQRKRADTFERILVNQHE